MANVKRALTESFVAGATLASSQYHGVKLNANRQVIVCAADTDIPAGIVLNDPASGAEAEVLVVGRCPVVLGETLTAGQLIRIDGSGHAMLFEPATDTTAYCIGQVTIGGAVTEVGEALINCCNPNRGIAS